MPTTLLVLVRNTSIVLEASDCLSAPCYVVGNLLADFHRYHTRGRLGASPVRCDMFTLILMGNISIIGQVGKLCLITGLFFPPQASNQLGQSPCLVAAYLQGACNNGSKSLHVIPRSSLLIVLASRRLGYPIFA